MLTAEVPLEMAAPQLGPTPAELLAHTLELEEYAQQEAEAAQQRAALKEQRRLERELAHLSLQRSEMGPTPALEVTVMRVVGCDMLTNGRTGRDFTVITYSGAAGEDSGR